MKLLILLLALSLTACSPVMAETVPNWGKLADAIRLAEGNANYGILSHYKHTSYRQACINTCKHQYRLWIKARQIASNSKIEYLPWLAKKYCPVGASNDPKGLNRNWLKNVVYFYNKGV